ncbi:MAG: CoA transferase, partial [Rhodospirillales bacterium]|nr:CoA transferase [Rhodospirillales bacterium]
MTLPLEGLLVVSLEQAVAAPFCSSRLADAGARVIKVERPGGDFARKYEFNVHGESAHFVWLNRGKESVIIDIKVDGDKAILERMISNADVFIQNLAPGAAARAGFGSDDLRARYPRLITCDISGYGEDNEYRDMKAYDLLVQAESGLTSVTGGPEAPARAGVSVCDIGAGMFAHAAILEALLGREKTGRGDGVSVSLFDGMADWMTIPLLYYDYGGVIPQRHGLRHPSIAPYAAFAAQDGVLIVISIQNEREWARFTEQILGHPEWATEGPYRDGVSRVENRETLEGEVNKAFQKWPAKELAEKLNRAGIAYGFVNDVSGLSSHPVLRRVRVDTETGPVEMPAPAIRHVAGEPE